MKQINNILSNSKRKYIQISETQITCADIITEIINTRINPIKIQHKNSTLTVSVPSIIKTEIYIHKTEILLKINKQGIIVTAIV